MTNIEKARQVAAQAWCDPETSDKVMDAALAEAFAKRLAVALDHLDVVTDLAVWMSGSSDFGPRGRAASAWSGARPRFFAAMRYLDDPAAPSAPDRGKE
jgi:hypothetical protein